MSRHGRSGAWRWALGLLACTAWTVAGAQEEPRFVAEQASGVVDPSGYSRVELVGLRGAVSVRAGKPGDLRFMCRDLSTRREDRPVALWASERALILGPAQGREEERVLCEVVVPPDLEATVAIDDGKVVLNGLPGRNTVRGARVDLDVRAITGSLDAEIAGGVVRAQGVGESVRLTGTGLEVTIGDVKGGLRLDLENSRARAMQIAGECDIDLEATELSVEGVDGVFNVSADGGQLELSTLRNGGTLHLAEAPTRLANSKGPLEIDTDSNFEARDMHGEVRLIARRGQLAVLGLSGDLYVDAVECTLATEKISGTTRIIGDALDLQLREVLGELGVRTTASQIVVAGASGPVTIDNDFGDVVVAKAEKAVTVNSAEGNVRVTQLSGPLQLRASGPEVTVHWTSVAHGEDSSVENDSGGVTALFSGDGGGRIEAESRRGQIASNIPGVQVDDDGRSAKGMINRLVRPTIRIVCEGDLSLSAGAPPEG